MIASRATCKIAAMGYNTASWIVSFSRSRKIINVGCTTTPEIEAIFEPERKQRRKPGHTEFLHVAEKTYTMVGGVNFIIDLHCLQLRAHACESEPER